MSGRGSARRLQYVSFVVGVTLMVTALTQLSGVWTWIDVPDSIQHVSFLSRRPLSLSNCTPPAVEQFPHDQFSGSQRRHGAVVLHIILAAYMFLALALVCDDYFVPSCERICSVLKLQDDVAGATFMAAGSSAPELATAVIGVFIAKDDIGLGAVVGSAVFNIMFVISLCALFAGTVVYLKWWPLLRDSVFYTFSILLLVFAIVDEAVYWYESLLFLLMYAVYIVLMVFNPRLEAWIVPKFPSLSHEGRPVVGEVKRIKVGTITSCEDLAGNNNEMTEIDIDSDDVSYDGHVETETLLPADGNVRNGSVDGIHKAVSQSVDDAAGDCLEMQELDVDDGIDMVDADQSTPWVWAVPTGWCKRVIWVLSWPLIAMMFLTVPDCRQPRWRSWFLVTFLASIGWIGIYSYLMVWMITIVGHTWSIPDSVMSLTLIAAGSSVPDAIASLIVVRDGYGDMAVSNAIGSNVFDILLCLGLPWFLQTTVVDRSQPVQVYSAGLTYSSITLLTTVVLLLVLTHLNRWRLTRPYGTMLLIIYVLFNVLSCLYELNVFAYLHPPECPSAD